MYKVKLINDRDLKINADQYVFSGGFFDFLRKGTVVATVNANSVVYIFVEK